MIFYYSIYLSPLRTSGKKNPKLLNVDSLDDLDACATRDAKEMLIKVSLIGQNQLIVLGKSCDLWRALPQKGCNISVNRNNVYAPQRPLTILRKNLHDSTSRWRLLIIISNVDIDFYFFDIISPKERKCAFTQRCFCHVELDPCKWFFLLFCNCLCSLFWTNSKDALC